MNVADCGVILFGSDCEVKIFNQQALSILEADAKNITIEIQEKIPRLFQLIETCFLEKKHFTNKKIGSEKLTLNINITPVEPKCDVDLVICSFQDASLIESIEQQVDAYKLINRRMESFIDMSFDGIWIVDHNGIVLCTNKASEELHKLKAENIVGMSVYDLAAQGLVERILSDRVLQTKQKLSEFTLINGKQVLATGSPIFDEQGELSFVFINERDMTELNALKEEIENSRMKVDRFQEELKKLRVQEHEQHGIIAESSAMLNVLQTCRKLSRLEVSNILILGESGTGKSMLAQYVHQNSRRSDGPFIHVNCAAIPEMLMEAELFGYEKGSFTGAKAQGKAGLIELAQGGTLFLDEIGDMPLQLQAKLLNYLDDQQFRRVGGTKMHKVDCIILAATNKNLEQLSEEQKFRSDLYYRLSTFPIKLPSLNEHPDDIPPLAAHFIEQYNQQYNLKRKATDAALSQLKLHKYHGNTRELRNMVKKAVILNETDVIDDILKFNDINREAAMPMPSTRDHSSEPTLKERLQAAEKSIFIEILKSRPTTRQIAKKLNIDHSTVVRKLKLHGLSTAGAKKHQA